MIAPAAATALWVIAFLASWLLTSRVRAYAVRREILDHPNERSSHARPTPRGGGLAIVVVVEACLVAIWLAGLLPWRPALALTVGSAAIALIGWMDDRRSLSSRLRLSVHLLVAVGTMWLLGGLPVLAIGPYRVTLGIAGAVLGILAIIWLLNLWNFMDGIDGIAGVEAVVAGLAMGALLWPTARGLSLVALAISSASAGFLLLNWQPARIFMGDVGSATLGFLFAALAVASERSGALPFQVTCLILAVFLVDATLTLFRRILGGETWHQAHRVHAYQRAVQSGRSHRQVSTGTVVLTTLLALGAWLVVRRPQLTTPILLSGFVLVLGAYLWVEWISPYRPPNRRP